jgi:hypothetical protein
MDEMWGVWGGGWLPYGYHEEVKQINALVPELSAQCTV